MRTPFLVHVCACARALCPCECVRACASVCACRLGEESETTHGQRRATQQNSVSAVCALTKQNKPKRVYETQRMGSKNRHSAGNVYRAQHMYSIAAYRQRSAVRVYVFNGRVCLQRAHIQIKMSYDFSSSVCQSLCGVR